MKTRRYDVLHAHFVLPDGFIAYVVHRLTGLPYVITAHGSDVPGYNPHRFRLLHKVLLPIWRQIVINASAILCPSKMIEGLVLANCPRAPTRVIPNAIDADKFVPGVKDPRSVLIVSRMFKRKGVQYALRALAQFPGAFEVNIVGDGPYLPTLVALAKSLKISVKFWGHLDNDSRQLAALYQTASIFVFTSDAENFPVVLLEAMSAGTAVISTQGTGCAEVVGGTGLLVPVRNAEAIRHELEHLASNPSLVAELGRSARARVIEKFGWASVVDRHLIEYAQASQTLALRAKSADSHAVCGEIRKPVAYEHKH